MRQTKDSSGYILMSIESYNFMFQKNLVFLPFLISTFFNIHEMYSKEEHNQNASWVYSSFQVKWE
jgi:hypothetical protein